MCRSQLTVPNDKEKHVFQYLIVSKLYKRLKVVLPVTTQHYLTLVYSLTLFTEDCTEHWEEEIHSTHDLPYTVNTLMIETDRREIQLPSARHTHTYTHTTHTKQ